MTKERTHFVGEAIVENLDKYFQVQGMKKVDLCMWAKNGSKFLPHVLKRIDDVIPPENVNKRIFVDDSSIDNSIEIAETFNWNVYKNTQGGICGGFNKALRHVESEFFVSVEQDVLLANDWWDRIPIHMLNESVAVAQGIRLPSHPLLKAIYEYKTAEKFTSSLDNNIWRTKVIRKIGGFPEHRRYMADRYLHPKVLSYGFEWVVDHGVVSVHIRENIKKTLEHYHGALMRSEIQQPLDSASIGTMAKILFEGLIRSAHIAIKENLPSIFLVYPYMSLLNFRTLWHRKVLSRESTSNHARN